MADEQELGRPPSGRAGGPADPSPQAVSAVPALIADAGRTRNQPMKRKTAQCQFVFSYLFDNMIRYGSGEWGGGCDGCVTYDEGEAFAVAFGEAFPGRKPDPKGALASARLRRIMAEMHADGWLYRRRLSNHDQYHPRQEPNWQYVYRLFDDHANKLRRGDWNAEYMARRYEGDGDPWAALARGIEARSDETAQQAQPEGQEPGPKDAPNIRDHHDN